MFLNQISHLNTKVKNIDNSVIKTTDAQGQTKVLLLKFKCPEYILYSRINSSSKTFSTTMTYFRMILLQKTKQKTTKLPQSGANNV